MLETPNGPLRGRVQTALGGGEPCRAFDPARADQARTAPTRQAAGVNRLTGRIAEAIYMGRGRKYVVETASGAMLTVTQPAAGAGTTMRGAGDQVAAHFAPEDAVIIVDAG